MCRCTTMITDMTICRFGLPCANDHHSSLPHRALPHRQAKQQNMFSAIIIKCVVQLSLIQTVEWIMLSSTDPTDHSPPPQSACSSHSIACASSCLRGPSRLHSLSLSLSVSLSLSSLFHSCTHHTPHNTHTHYVVKAPRWARTARSPSSTRRSSGLKRGRRPCLCPWLRQERCSK